MEEVKKEDNNPPYKISPNKKIPIPKYNSFTSKNNHIPKNEINNNNNNKAQNSDLINLDKKILSSIFFKKYKPIKLIGSGTFSVVYEGINIKDNTKVALKLEEKNTKISLLESEALNIFSLQGFGIIKFISFGHNKDFNILVEPLLGESLYSLYLYTKKNFYLKDICLIGIQALERIEHIHSKGYLHVDIKPENFLIGNHDPRIIYIIDFGLSKKYRSDRTGNHIQFCITKKMNGTARYASTNSLRGVEISRRDDLESLAYMIIYFFIKKLPWQGVKANTLQNRYKKIYYMKKKLTEDSMFKQLPIEIQEFYKDIKRLKFEEKPNYNKLKEYFRILLRKNGLKEDNNFSWINNECSINTKEINLKVRKSNSQQRLMDKLLQKSNKKELKEEEEKHYIKSYNSSKYKFGKKKDTQNICYNNEYAYYSSNNKDIKSINEAIDIDVGDFSENEEEKQKNTNYLIQKKLKKYNSDFKKKEFLFKNAGKNIDNYNLDKEKKEIYNKKCEEGKNQLYNYEIKSFTSFNKKAKIEKNNQKVINNQVNNFQRCNINKNYLIKEFKSNKNKISNNMVNNENLNNININNNINNDKNEKMINYRNNNDIKRSKSGEKCFIQ